MQATPFALAQRTLCFLSVSLALCACGSSDSASDDLPTEAEGDDEGSDDTGDDDEGTECATDEFMPHDDEECVTRTDCSPGEFVVSEGDQHQDRTCFTCAQGSYSTTLNADRCSLWTACQPGEYRREWGTSSTDSACAPCADGTFDHDSDDSTLCLAKTTCPSGWIVDSEGSTTIDRSCSPCGRGFFTTDDNSESCTPWGTCMPGEFVSTPPSSFSNRVCAPCVESYSIEENQPFCEPWLECREGRVQATSGSATEDRTCQSWRWVTEFGTTASDQILAMVVDSEGSIYVTGATYGEMVPGGELGDADVYLRKLSETGQHLWTVQFGEDGSDFGQDLALDDDDNVHVTGYIRRQSGGHAAFVHKYDGSGNELWTRDVSTPLNDYGYGIDVTAQGDVYVTGFTYGAFPSEVDSASWDGFLAKLNSSGDTQWVRQLGSAGDDRMFDVSADLSGNVYVTGQTDGVFDVDASEGAVDIVVAQYDADGVQQWARQIGSDGGDTPTSVIATADGVYFTGNTDGDVDGTGHGGADGLLGSVSTLGTVNWVRQFGTASNDAVSNAVRSPSGDIYIVGGTTGELDGWFTEGSGDAFVQVFTSTGVESFSRQLGTSASDSGKAIAISEDAHLLIAGNTAGAFPNQINEGSEDAFVTRLVE